MYNNQQFQNGKNYFLNNITYNSFNCDESFKESKLYFMEK